MLTVKTFLAASPIHGVGCFAADKIAAGQIVWSLTSCDVNVTNEDLAELTELQRDLIMHHAWYDLDLNVRILSCDNAKYFNHSDTPNVVYPNDPKTGIAARDIPLGEELTEDYRSFDADADIKLRDGERKD